MSKEALIGLASIVVIVVLGGIVLTTGGENTSSVDNRSTTTDATSSADLTKNLITAKHQYNPDQSLHIIAGETDVPTPCHILNTEVNVNESQPEQANISFTANVEDGDQVCAQVITPARFKVTFQASENAEISATYNGEPVELNLLEVDPDEDLEEFQVYTKG